MTVKEAPTYPIAPSQRPFRVGALLPAIVFVGSYLVLFLGMMRHPGVFDEGIILTGALRVGAKQIPHRDFYVLYGPAQFYILAGLFKLFGKSILVERLFDLLVKALVITTVYAIAASFCRRSIAALTATMALLWLFGLNQWPGSATTAVSLLSLISSALILPVFERNVSPGRAFATGAVAGIATLFRYDTGVALLGVHVCVMAVAVYCQYRGLGKKVHTLASNLGLYLLGFAAMTGPPAVYYTTVAPLRFLIHDMFGYPSKYYYRGRNLPFPGVGIHSIENIGIYLPAVITAVSIYVAVFGLLPKYRRDHSDIQVAPDPVNWYGVLFTFGLLTAALYLKGYVRVTLFQVHLAIIPSVLLLAALLERRSAFPRVARIGVLCLTTLSFLAPASLAFHEAKELYLTHSSVPEYLFAVIRRETPPKQAAWCSKVNAVTTGFCFLPDEDRIRTIEFITSHTTPYQPIYVGLIEHQKIFAADNILYFATLRLPATKWSELDPDLESRSDIQAQMVQELEATAAPYIVLDSEFERNNEPNDSSKSSGVTLLDEYIRNKYEHEETYGIMTIWKRRSNRPAMPS
jgi:hypothetical protein